MFQALLIIKGGKLLRVEAKTLKVRKMLLILENDLLPMVERNYKAHITCVM